MVHRRGEADGEHRESGDGAEAVREALGDVSETTGRERRSERPASTASPFRVPVLVEFSVPLTGAPLFAPPLRVDSAPSSKRNCRG
jgi:hypothetical protein